MDDMDVLAQLFKNTALATPQNDAHDNSMVTLSEPQEPDSKAEIRHLPKDAIVIKVDAFCSPDAIFNGSNGECKRADYVIISAEKKCIIYIELKRTKDNWTQIVKQLLGAQCFIKYCQEIGKEFWKKDDFLKDYKSRFISIGHTNIAKKKTRITSKAKQHDTPEKAMKIDWPHYLQFNRIAALNS